MIMIILHTLKGVISLSKLRYIGVIDISLLFLRRLKEPKS